jgi:hypothetical protein
LQTIFDQQRDLVGQAKLDLIGQTAGFAEIDKVFERECEGDGLCQVDIDVVFGLINIGVAAQVDHTRADITLALELDAVFRALD